MLAPVAVSLLLAASPPPDAMTVRAAMPEAPLVEGETFEVTLEVELGEGWTASDAGIPKPILQLQACEGVVPVGAEPADFRQYARNEFLDTPWERLLDPGSTVIPFRVEARPGADAVIALNVVAYLVPPGVERVNGEPPADAWFIRRRIELPVRSAATGVATTPATRSDWGDDDRLQIGDRAPDFTLPCADGSNVTLSEHRGKNVIVTTYRAFW